VFEWLFPKRSCQTQIDTELKYVLGNADRAIEELQRVLEIDSPFKIAYTNLAAILYNRRRYQEAEAVMRKGIAVLGDWPNASLTLGVVLIAQGDRTAEAWEHLKSAVAQAKIAKTLFET
jgi:Flp pilus assembly protein TadD